MCWQLCATFSFPPNWQQKKLDSIFYQLLRCSYILSRSQGCQFLSSNLEKRFIFWEGDDTRAPPACSPSIPALVSWKSCFQFHTASMGWELGSVDSGQSVMGCSLETHPFSSTPKKEKLQQKIPKEDHKKNPSPSAAESVFAIAGPQLRQLCCSHAKEKQPLGKSQ